MADQAGAASLFAIFFLAIYSLILIPVSIYLLCNPKEETVKPWEASSKRKPSAVTKFLRRMGLSTVIGLTVAWALWVAIVVYVQYTAKDLSPFDPFEILGVSHDASKQEVSSAYRKLALQYHPDRNPDPEAGKYFAEFINKAYKALTDKVSRENYEKYGHPDGPQAMRLLPVVALPEWLLSGDSQRAPLVLALLVVLGIVMPLCVAARYLMTSTRYAGPNSVMAETMEIFFRSKFAVKESQSLARIDDTLTMAYEFIIMPTPKEQAEGLEELRKTTLRLFPEFRDKKQAWFKGRKASIVKAHMLLLAHLDREPIPASLAADHRFVVTKCILLLEEMVKIAQIPRVQGTTTGWLAPTLGSLEMMQCITMAVSQDKRRSLGTAGKAGSDTSATVLQLPHVTQEVLRKLGRRKARTLADLLSLSPDELQEVLTSCGLTGSQAITVHTALEALPTVEVEADFSLDGETGDIAEGDIVTCTARAVLHRASHQHSAFRAPAEGSSVQAYAPSFPGTRQERWFFVLANTAANAVLSVQGVNLLRAEAAGVARTLGDDHQTVELKFVAPQQGKFDLTLLCISDCWVGCDVALPLKLRVVEKSRAEKEGRTGKGPAAAAEQPEAASDEGGSEAGEDDEEDEEEGDWDSDETGTEETGSGSEAEADEKKPLVGKRATSEADSGKSSTAPLPASTGQKL